MRARALRRCIIEIFFTFELRPGIEEPCIFLDLDAAPQDDRSELGFRFGGFDVKHAQCNVPEDQDHLLGIIESSFGDLQRFNRIVASLTERFC